MAQRSRGQQEPKVRNASACCSSVMDASPAPPCCDALEELPQFCSFFSSRLRSPLPVAPGEVLPAPSCDAPEELTRLCSFFFSQLRSDAPEALEALPAPPSCDAPEELPAPPSCDAPEALLAPPACDAPEELPSSRWRKMMCQMGPDSRSTTTPSSGHLCDPRSITRCAGEDRHFKDRL
ncbi:unnamed protein product [Closterium sp. NIES-64]|nr:unnamed protein product [Closterium sp. NIES-64]